MDLELEPVDLQELLGEEEAREESTVTDTTVAARPGRPLAARIDIVAGRLRLVLSVLVLLSAWPLLLLTT